MKRRSALFWFSILVFLTSLAFEPTVVQTNVPRFLLIKEQAQGLGEICFKFDTSTGQCYRQHISGNDNKSVYYHIPGYPNYFREDQFLRLLIF